MSKRHTRFLPSIAFLIAACAAAQQAPAQAVEKGALDGWLVVHGPTKDGDSCQASTCKAFTECSAAEGAGLLLWGSANRAAVTPTLRFSREVPVNFRARLTIGRKNFLFGYGQGSPRNAAISESVKADKDVMRALARHARSRDATVQITSGLGDFDVALGDFRSVQAFIESRCGIKPAR